MACFVVVVVVVVVVDVVVAVVVCLFVCFSSSCCLFCLFFLVFLFCFVFFFIRDGLGTKDLVFHGGLGVVALIRKNTGVLGGAGHYNLCWPEYLGGFLIFNSGLGRCQVSTSCCGKINWVVIRIKLCWSDYKLMLPMRLEKAFSELFIIFLNLLISLFIHLHLFIYSLIFLFIH